MIDKENRLGWEGVSCCVVRLWKVEVERKRKADDGANSRRKVEFDSSKSVELVSIFNDQDGSRTQSGGVLRVTEHSVDSRF